MEQYNLKLGEPIYQSLYQQIQHYCKC